jgi:hypothetical protein
MTIMINILSFQHVVTICTSIRAGTHYVIINFADEDNFGIQIQASMDSRWELAPSKTLWSRPSQVQI